MTVLVSDMGDTIIATFADWTIKAADWTVLPKEGLWKTFLEKHPWILLWVQKHFQKRASRKRLEQGFPIGPEGEETEEAPKTLETLAAEDGPPTESQLVRDLSKAIKKAAGHLTCDPPKKYSYEEWVDFTRLIRFSSTSREAAEIEEEEQSLIQWDWIGHDSPMLADVSEAEWVLDRLCESLNRCMMRRASVIVGQR